VILLAAITTVSNWPEITHDFSGSTIPGALARRLGDAARVVVLHEFAHGLTCKHFGGKVYEMGLLRSSCSRPCLQR